MSSLYVINGKQQGRRFLITEPIVRLGRDSSNSLRLQDTEVSRSHAEVMREGEGLVLRDLKSSNGTFVNGKPIERHLLQSGDRVQLGRTVMLFTQSELTPQRDLSSLVDIVDAYDSVSESRIVSTLGQEEGSRLLSGPQPDESPWLARARSNLQVMYRTSLAVSHTLDIDELLRRILDLIFEWVEADRGCIMLLETDSGKLLPKATKNRRQSSPSAQWQISRTILDYVLQHEQAVLTSDAQDDQRWDDAASILSLGVHEAICVPLQGRYGIVGVVYIDTRIRPPGSGRVDTESSAGARARQFTEEHLKLMVAIGHQAALAVEDTSYYSALLQSERLAAVGQTVATLSHHIKNILQGIRGGSYLIEEGLKEEDFEVVTQGWKIVERNQERISNMVMDMLSFSKERKPEFELGDVCELVEDVLQIVRPKAMDVGVKLEWLAGPQLTQIAFDQELLHRAVLNVVGNAIDACSRREHGEVKVRVEFDSDSQNVGIVVEDNGEGIEPEDLEDIFRAFESTKGGRGTGLGLPVSRKIMREHNGDIAVQSDLGSGSRFTLWMPVKNSLASAEIDERMKTHHFDPN